MVIKQTLGCSLLALLLGFAGTVAAAPLVSGGVLTGTIASAGGTDRHTFDAAVGDSFILSIGDIGETNFFPWIRVFDPSGSQVGSTFGSVAGTLQRRATAAGTYTVVVADGSSGGARAGSYSLNFVQAPGSQAVPSGDEGGALTNGIAHFGDITLADIDAYQFTANVGDSFVFSIGDTGETGLTPWVRVYDPSGFQVGSTFGSVAGTLQRRATVAGTYTVVVSDASGGGTQTGSYSLDFVKAPGSQVVPSGDEGGALTNGIAHFGDITLADIDTYQFTANVGDSFVFSIGDTGETGLTPWVRVYDPSGLQVGSTFGSVAGTLQRRATVAGTYTVVVSDGSGGGTQTGSYSLDFVKVPGASTILDGDQGGALSSGSLHAGDITLADLDSYQFTANADDSFVVSIGDTGETDFVPWTRVFDPNGLQVGSTFGSVAGTLQRRASVSGTYTVVVSDGSGGGVHTGSYALHLVKTPGNHTISDGDDGAVIRDGDVLNAEITVGDTDVWVFGLGAGGQITIEVQDIASTSLVPWIRVFDPNGLQVGSRFNAETASLPFTATLAGDYLAVVSDGTGGSTETGDYELRFSSTNDIAVTTRITGNDEDPDNDGLVNSEDNCPNTPNSNQADTGGIDTFTPDGIGDACQCGDMNGDGRVTNSDSVLIRRQLLDLSSPFSANLCDVNGDGNCTNSDSVVIRRALLGLPPGVGQTCAATRLANGIEPQ